jgi:hypothetical protein
MPTENQRGKLWRERDSVEWKNGRLAWAQYPGIVNNLPCDSWKVLERRGEGFPSHPITDVQCRRLAAVFYHPAKFRPLLAPRTANQLSRYDHAVNPDPGALVSFRRGPELVQLLPSGVGGSFLLRRLQFHLPESILKFPPALVYRGLGFGIGVFGGIGSVLGGFGGINSRTSLLTGVESVKEGDDHQGRRRASLYSVGPLFFLLLGCFLGIGGFFLACSPGLWKSRAFNIASVPGGVFLILIGWHMTWLALSAIGG